MSTQKIFGMGKALFLEYPCFIGYREQRKDQRQSELRQNELDIELLE